MRIPKLILAATIILNISCGQQPEQDAVYLGKPRVVEAIGYVVPQDSISEPHEELIDKQKLRKVPIRKPEVIRSNNNILLVRNPKTVIAGIPRVSTPGVDTFSRILSVPVTGHEVVGGLPEVVNAKDPYSKDQNPQNFSSFSKKQGMKNAFLGKMIEDTMGNLWIAHGGGVSKYDGKTFTHFGKKDGLSDNSVLSILEDKDGNLWFGTNSGGVTRYDGRTFINYTEADGLTDNTVYTIMQDKNRNLWFATMGGATKYDGKTFTRFSTREGLMDNTINDILEDRHGNIWLASEQGVSKFDGTSFSHFTEKEGLSNKIVNCIIEDLLGNLWFGTYGGGVNKYNGHTFTHFTVQEGLLNNFIYSIIQDHEGNLWIGSNAGLIKYNGESISVKNLESVGGVSETEPATFTNYTEHEGLSNQVVFSILEDRFGNLWIATFGGGLNKYNGNTFTHFTDKEGLAGNEVTAIVQNEDGSLWFGTSRGISLYDGNSFANYTVNEELSNTFIKVIIKDQMDNLWLGTDGGGIDKYSPPQKDAPATIHYLMETTGFFDRIILSMLQDRAGNIWFSTLEGVYKYNEGSKTDTKATLTRYTESEGLSNNTAYCMLEDRTGNIWFGTLGGGVTKYQPPTSVAPESFTHFTEREGFLCNTVRSMLEDHEGNIWFGTDAEGVVKYTLAHDGQPSTFTFLTEKEGLSSNAVLSILEDKDRNLWFGTRMGLSILTSKKAAEYSDKVKAGTVRESDVFLKNYTYENGFLGVGCTVNSILEDNDGNVWIGANDRLTVCHPMVTETTYDSIAPNIQLTGISLFSELIAWTTLEHHQDSILKLGNGVIIKNFSFDSSSKWYGLPVNLSLAYNNNYLSFNYTGITMNQPNRVRYQYKLEGNDEQWSALTLRTEAPYGNLAHGSYTFKVKAMNSEGYWSNELQFPFSIRPPWWHTWWAYTLYGVSILSLFISVERFQKQRTILKERQKANQKQSILKERLRISQDLHDEVGATLSGISMYSHLAKEQIKAEQQNELLNSLSIMQESSGEMVTKLNDIVWLLNPDQAQLHKLIEKLEAYARQMAEFNAVTVTVDISATIAEIELPLDVRRNVYLIFKEGINNTIKYSQATTLNLSVRDFDHSLEVTLYDNGVGFNPDTIKKGNGLDNMQKRAKEIGALIHLNASPGKGTHLSLTYKLLP